MVSEPLPTPVASVLLPCWNAAGTIAIALESVLESRSPALEVVVVDDASTDGSLGIVEAIAARDPRVVVVRQAENGGVSAARNRGLQVVRGEWLAFVDADDCWLPGGIDRLMAHAAASDPLAVIGQREWTDGRGTWISNEPIADIRRPGRKSLATNPGLVYYAALHGKLLHRSTWEGTRFEGRVLGDLPWTMEALLRAGDRIDVLPEVVYQWRRSRVDRAEGGITALSRSSARQGAVAAGVARDGFTQVRTAAERSIPDAGARRRLVALYLERLVRADLSGYLRRALARRDPTLPALLEANASFLENVAPDLLASSDAVRQLLLVPPLHHWPRLSPESKLAWDAMAAPVFRASPGLERRLARERSGRFTVYVRTTLDRVRHVTGRGRLALRQWRVKARLRLRRTARGSG